LLQPFNKKGVPSRLISRSGAEIGSVAVMDFVMEVEDHFDIDIPERAFETRSIGIWRRSCGAHHTGKSMQDLFDNIAG
jgi:hypothetical protein